MILAIRLFVAIAIAAIVTTVVGTPEIITQLMIGLPVFGVSFWAVGFVLRDDSGKDGAA